MKKFSFKYFSIFLIFFSSLFVSCLPQISVKAGNSDSADVSFTTGFSQNTAKTLKTLIGLDASSPIFKKEDILSLLKSAGVQNPKAELPSSTEISADGKILPFSNNFLCKTGILSKSENSLSLTIGTSQILAFYEILDDEAKSYLDLMMIPALIGEKMTAAEYRELLASMYGPAFADEITGGKLTVSLSSPDGKKTLKETISLGELFTKAETRWELKY